MCSPVGGWVPKLSERYALTSEEEDMATRMRAGFLAVLMTILGCTPADSSGEPDEEGLQGEGATATEALQGSFAEWDGEFLVTPARIGPVTPEIGRDLLAAMLADDALEQAVYIGEGQCAPGMVLFPGTLNEVEIIWLDDDGSAPAAVQLRSSGSDWRTPKGVTVGTSLKELEQWAGDVLTFSGFGWDYGGSLLWEEEGDLRLRFLPGGGEMARVAGDPRYGEILGDREVRSDHPLIRSMTIRVGMMSTSWGYPQSTYDCG